MRKVKIDLADLVIVLEAMRETNGTTEIIFFEHNGLPAICDANDQENVITFQTFDPKKETKDGDQIH